MKRRLLTTILFSALFSLLAAAGALAYSPSPFSSPFGPQQPILTEPGVIPQAPQNVSVPVTSSSSTIYIPNQITGSVKSGTFQVNETVTQTGTNVTAVVLAVPGSSGPLQVGGLSATTSNAYGTWVGQTSAAVFAPTATPLAPNYVIFSPLGGFDFCELMSNSYSTSIAVPTILSYTSVPEANPAARVCTGWKNISFISATSTSGVVVLLFFQ